MATEALTRWDHRSLTEVSGDSPTAFSYEVGLLGRAPVQCLGITLEPVRESVLGDFEGDMFLGRLGDLRLYACDGIHRGWRLQLSLLPIQEGHASIPLVEVHGWTLSEAEQELSDRLRAIVNDGRLLLRGAL